MDIKPIKTKRDYETALKEVERLMDAKPNTEQGDRFDVLATLVEAYEDRHWPIDPPTAAEALRFYLDQQGLAPADLEPLMGGRSHVYGVLSGRHGFSMEVAYRLHSQLGIPAEVLIQPVRQKPAKRRKRAS